MKLFTIFVFLLTLLSPSVTATPLLSNVQRFVNPGRRRYTNLRHRRTTFTDLASRHHSNSHDCFPASALVSVANQFVPIENLKIGDIVTTAFNRLSPVYTFTHTERNGMYTFISMKTQVGTLIASPGHYIYDGNGIPTTASKVMIGDRLLHSRNGSVTVEKVDIIRAKGLYNPQTLDGRLVVEGFVVSTFTEAIEEPVAQSLLAPLRATFSITSLDFSGGYIASQGVIRSLLLSVLNLVSN